jgi:predicted HD phosphohydrolase
LDDVFRHTAFFLFNENITPDKHLAMLKGLAYMRFEIPSVLALDYGSDLFGGSTQLREIKPYRRTPRWRAAEEGPPCNYDVALQLDFTDAEGNQAYNEDDVHHEVGEYNAAIGQPELTARIDWEYEGEPLIRRGHVRHSAMFLWADTADTAARESALEQVRRLESADEVEALTLGHNIGKLTTDYDWIFDIHTPDEASAKRLIHSDAYAEVMRAIAPVTKYEWTARISHVMRGL